MVSRKTRNLDFWTKFNDPRVNDLVEATEEFASETAAEIDALKEQVEELQIMLDAAEEDNNSVREKNLFLLNSIHQALVLLQPNMFTMGTRKQRIPEWHEIEGATQILKKAL